MKAAINCSHFFFRHRFFFVVCDACDACDPYNFQPLHKRSTHRDEKEGGVVSLFCLFHCLSRSISMFFYCPPCLIARLLLAPGKWRNGEECNNNDQSSHYCIFVVGMYCVRRDTKTHTDIQTAGNRESSRKEMRLTESLRTVRERKGIHAPLMKDETCIPLQLVIVTTLQRRATEMRQAELENKNEKQPRKCVPSMRLTLLG